VEERTAGDEPVQRRSEDVYTHGHQEAVLRSHRWRSASNSSGYLLAHLKRGMDLLDVGCGPATVTLDLAGLVDPGSVVGIDREPAVVAEAAAYAARRGVVNASFSVGDAYALDFGAESFDVVHAHQLLQHLSRPVEALSEMRRVLRRGGILAVRDSDYGGFVWSPEDPLLGRWMEIYHAVCRSNGADADAGRHLLGWVRQAGFSKVSATSSTWTFAEPDSRRWWSDLWAERVVGSSFAHQAVDYGLATSEELQEISGAWRRWGEQDDGFFAVLHAEVLATR
jgi:SAM-dependent methyltransferase